MKKFLITFIVWIVIFSTNIAFWWYGECKIKDWPAPSLDKYISNLRKVIWNISKEVSSTESKLSSQEKKSWIKKDISSIKSRITQFYNKMIDWDSYYSYFDFYVMYSIKNDYVAEIWRDYDLLEKESVWLDKYLKYITKKWYDSFSLTKEKVCQWIDTNCDFSWDILEVIWQVITNHESVKDYYRLSIIWKKNLFKGKLKLVWDDFESDFSSYYNENTTNNCSQYEPNWWFAKIQKEIEKISNWQENTKNWIKSWQDAIAILNWSWPDKNNERLERKLLEKEMRRNWTSLQSSNILLKNLSRYNETWWFSLDNNFITNSYNQIKSAVVSQIQSFTDSILQLFKDKPKYVPISNIWKTRDDLKNTRNIEETIKEMYRKELPYAQLQDISTENLQAKIIEIHYNMSQAIYYLDKTKKISCSVSKNQGTKLPDWCVK